MDSCCLFVKNLRYRCDAIVPSAGAIHKIKTSFARALGVRDAEQTGAQQRIPVNDVAVSAQISSPGSAEKV